MTNRNLKTRSKLLVIVTEEELDEVKFAKKARSIAEYYDLDILFLGKVVSFETEPFLRRRLITLSGISNNNLFKTDFSTFSQKSWQKLLSQVYKPGDYILCPKEMMISSMVFTSHPLFDEINKKFGNSVIGITGLMNIHQNNNLKSMFYPVLHWVGIISILTIAFGLEANFGSHTYGWFRVLGEISIVTIEIFSLWVWNSITNQG
jgi:hypothetical protein